jgi:regulator of protease activity HflC (stomatin/prohibitin superfamily)
MLSSLGVLLIIGCLIGFLAAFGATNAKGKSVYTGWAIPCVIGFAIGILMTCMTTVPRGHVGVSVLFSGVTGDYRTQGLQFKSPLVKLVNVNIQTQKEEVEATAASKDLQDVATRIALNYHLNPSSAPQVYRDLGLDYIVKVADPAIQETVKQVTARHNAEDLIRNREVIKGEITEELNTRLTPRGIVIEALSITNFQFSSVFTAAIESKVSAQQAVFEAQNKLERVKVEAQQAQAEAVGKANAVIASANGQAEAIKIVTEAQVKANDDISNSLTPDVLQYIFIDRLSKNINVVVIPQGQSFVLPDITTSPTVTTTPIPSTTSANITK